MSRDLNPIETVIADAIARARYYNGLAEVDAVDDGEPEEIRNEARQVSAALEADRESGARLRAGLLQFCDSAEQCQGPHAWVPTSALRMLLTAGAS